MKKLYLIFSIACLLTFNIDSLLAQENISEVQELTKEEKKALKKEQKQKKKEERQKEKELRKSQESAIKNAEFELAKKSLEDTTFLLSADYLFTKRGRMIPVTERTNFIYVKDGEATLQLAFNGFMAPGPNGIGGITLEGRISDIKCTTTKNGSISYRFNVMGSGLMANVTVHLVSGSNVATATVNSNVSSGRIEFKGTLTPLDENAIYKGMRSF
ncbi:DUF4251 domain-containing protein [Sediminitomix flava]|uniref:Uncharacterized protein DUF4251 n=1 Tax=Sediminitomix flava TaxID=379075 RepID=A0A315Z947_SEDFL|nr:DUF4251 domain-containing protein [Sediminitomix flava]PWJ42085.1 uncharacterized protein DUF4251 [Sediminitomix flava]